MPSLRKVFTSEIKSIDEKEMTLTASISTGARDRMNESLDPDGIDMRNYRKNPVVLWAHNYEQPPIGKAMWVKKEGDGIISKVKFASTAFAQEIFQLYKEGFLKAFSVGFIPKEIEEGDGEKQPRRTFRKWELLEYSAVPVPANPEALALAMQKGILKTESLREEMQKSQEVQDDTWPEDEKSTESVVAPVAGADASAPAQEQKEVKKETPVSPGLDELLAENKLFAEKNAALEKEITGLKYKIYELGESLKTKSPEITAETLSKTIAEVVGGVIRKAQGKVS